SVDVALEVAEAPRPVEERRDDLERPAVADRGERLGERGGGDGGGHRVDARVVASNLQVTVSIRGGGGGREGRRSMAESTVLDDIGSAIGHAAHERGPAVVGVGGGWRAGTGTVIAPNRVLTQAGNLRRGEATVTFGPAREREEAGSTLAVDRDLQL